MTSPWMRLDQAAEYFSFPSTAAFRKWCERQTDPPVVFHKLGRQTRVHKDDIEARMTRRFAAASAAGRTKEAR